MISIREYLVNDLYFATILISNDPEVSTMLLCNDHMILAPPTYQVLASPNLYSTIGQCVHCTVVKVNDKQPVLSLIGECI